MAKLLARRVIFYIVIGALHALFFDLTVRQRRSDIP